MTQNTTTADLLDRYFTTLIATIEASELGNNGKDENGFFQPTRTFVLQKLNLLKDLHRNAGNPHAKAMMKSSWQYVVEHVPPEWLVLEPKEKDALKSILN